MKQIRFTKYILPATLLLTLGSCSKSFLELSPPSQIEETNFFKTELQASQALGAVYHVLQWGNINQGHTPLIGWAEAASDDAYAGGGSSTDAVGVKGLDNLKATATAPFVPTDGTYGSVWSIYYQGVARANVLLANIDKTEAGDDFKKMVTAEAKFLRAHFNFDLVRWFENVRLILEPLTDPAKYSQPQATPQEVLDQVAKDLVEAMEVLPKKSIKANDAHATYWSASALLARVYLYGKGVYGTDLTAGTTAINAARVREYLEEMIAPSAGFDLIPVYSDVWRKANEMGVESVWEVSHSNLAYQSGSTSDQFRAQGNYNVLYFGPRGVSGKYTAGFSNAIPTQALYEEFETSPIADPRREATILILNSPADAAATTFIRGWQHTGYFNNKYNTTEEYKTSSGLNDINWGQNNHLIRFSDVLLMASELYIGVDQAKADQYLNRVRARAGLTARVANEENLRHERRVELAGEGVRYWDLLRYGLPYAKQMIDASGLIGPYYNGGGTFNAGVSTPANAYTMDWDVSKRGHLPIPPTQVTLSNGVLKQNAGY